MNQSDLFFDKFSQELRNYIQEVVREELEKLNNSSQPVAVENQPLVPSMDQPDPVEMPAANYSQGLDDLNKMAVEPIEPIQKPADSNYSFDNSQTTVAMDQSAMSQPNSDMPEYSSSIEVPQETVQTGNASQSGMQNAFNLLKRIGSK
jgi:hypothetical protein